MAPARSSTDLLAWQRPGLRAVAAWSLLALVLGALSAWEGTLFRDSTAAHWSVGGAIAVAIVGGGLAGKGRQRTPSSAWLSGAAQAVAGYRRHPPTEVAGVVVWVVLVLAVIGWDLNNFVHQSHYLPTLSRLIGNVTRFDWGRGIVFAGWMGLGAYVAFGWRRTGDEGPGHEGRR